MMLPVTRTLQAESDLADIFRYLDNHSPTAADALAGAIQHRCELLEQFPEMGRARDDVISGLRSIVIDKYVLFYRVKADAVEVLRILHGSRDVERILKQETDT